VTRANAFVEESAPWKLVKEEDGTVRVNRVLWQLLEAIRHAVCYLYPVMPQKMAEAYTQLGLGDIAVVRLADLSRFAFPEGVTVEKGNPLFPRRE
jgi:methionyl-tRNA synthetase